MAEKKLEDMTTEEFLKAMEESTKKKETGPPPKEPPPPPVKDVGNPAQAQSQEDALRRRNKALKETLKD